MTRSLISGDQSFVWDAPLKLAVLAHRGMHVQHSVHTADLFSRPPKGADALALTHEAYLPDGNVTRWTASLEACTFLGRMPIHPSCFTSVGVDFERVASFRDSSLEETVRLTTKGDWQGVSLPQKHADRVAHGLRVASIHAQVPVLRRDMRQSLQTSVVGMSDARLRHFDRLFALGEHQGGSWDEAALALTARHLDDHGVDRRFVALGCTALHSDGVYSSLFPIVLRYYDIAKACYNQAVAEGGEGMTPLAPGELPFYAIVEKSGVLVRENFVHSAHTTDADSLIRSSFPDRKVVAIHGKAILLMMELRMRGGLIMSTKGSAYTPTAVRFSSLFTAELAKRGVEIGLHPIHRLKFHALDALESVDATFHLPDHLQRFFGGEKVRARDFAHGWRGAVEAANQEVERLSGTDLSQVASTLLAMGRLGPHVVEDIKRLSGRRAEFDAVVKGAYEDLRQTNQSIGSLPKDEQKEARRVAKDRADAIRLQAEGVHEPEILRAETASLTAAVDARRALVLRDALAVRESLPYWNCRPFTFWVDAVPGWRESILDRSEIEIDPLCK